MLKQCVKLIFDVCYHGDSRIIVHGVRVYIVGCSSYMEKPFYSLFFCSSAKVFSFDVLYSRSRNKTYLFRKMRVFSWSKMSAIIQITSMCASETWQFLAYSFINANIFIGLDLSVFEKVWYNYLKGGAKLDFLVYF